MTTLNLPERFLYFWISGLPVQSAPFGGQWPFQDPKLEVPTIYKAYFSGLCKGISPQNIGLKNGTVPPF